MTENAEILASQPEAVANAINDIGEKIITNLRLVFDPEIPVNIYDMGLVYNIDLKPLDDGKVDAHILMTLTSPNCPVAEQMPAMVRSATEAVDEVNKAKVELVWEPTWDKSMMSDEAKLLLNLF
jgi:FeS assembly SUF system protein